MFMVIRLSFQDTFLFIHWPSAESPMFSRPAKALPKAYHQPGVIAWEYIYKQTHIQYVGGNCVRVPSYIHYICLLYMYLHIYSIYILWKNFVYEMPLPYQHVFLTILLSLLCFFSLCYMLISMYIDLQHHPLTLHPLLHGREHAFMFFNFSSFANFLMFQRWYEIF